MKMIDFTHTKRPEFIQLVLIIAVVCLALGAITPAASAVDYDWEFSLIDPNATPSSYTFNGYFSGDIGIIPDGLYYDDGSVGRVSSSTNKFAVKIHIRSGSQESEWLTELLPNLYTYGLVSSVDMEGITTFYNGDDYYLVYIPRFFEFPYTWTVPVSPNYFYVDVVDSEDDYQISVSGFDGTQLAGSAYTIAVSTYSGGYNLPLTSYPMYLGDSPVHLWTTDQTFILPVYLSDGVTPIDYYCMLSFPADPTATGYPFWWNMTTHGSLDYPFNTTYPPVVLPTPTPLIPSDIIPDPNDLNNTVNFTGWYQDQGFEGNNITAPIYSGLRGWFNENMIPVFEFFLIPIGSLSSMISESAGTATNAIDDSVEQLSGYASPMNIVGGYVVLLVPNVVWVVVFAALSIGYVVLLIRISTGSIRDTIGRFLGRW